MAESKLGENFPSMKNREQRDLFPGALEMMILRTLKRQPLHGYALAQHIKRTSKDLLQIEEGSLYPALQRLLKEELVKSRVEHLVHQPPRAHLQADRKGSQALGTGSVALRKDARRNYAGLSAG
jgi:DNA-binding PadR family transcriptional regulator